MALTCVQVRIESCILGCIFCEHRKKLVISTYLILPTSTFRIYKRVYKYRIYKRGRPARSCRSSGCCCLLFWLSMFEYEGAVPSTQFSHHSSVQSLPFLLSDQKFYIFILLLEHRTLCSWHSPRPDIQPLIRSRKSPLIVEFVLVNIIFEEVCDDELYLEHNMKLSQLNQNN